MTLRVPGKFAVWDEPSMVIPTVKTFRKADVHLVKLSRAQYPFFPLVYQRYYEFIGHVIADDGTWVEVIVYGPTVLEPTSQFAFIRQDARRLAIRPATAWRFT